MNAVTRRRLWLSFWATVVIVFTLAPLYWMVATSFKSYFTLGLFPPSPFPNPPTLQNYRQAFVVYHFQGYIENSVIVAVSTTILVLFFGSLAGYALGRLPIRGKTVILVALLMISVFPEIAVISPLYMLMRSIGWLNSYQALIVPYTAFNLPFAIWILRNYFLSIPKEMEEAARIDGASGWRTLFQVILPQATSGLFTAGVFTFTAAWTEFLMALTFNASPQFRTIPVGIALFGAQFVIPYGTLFAASTVAVLPIALGVLIFRRAVVSGLTQGAVKG
ncbi:binding-protein-dependent transport systems inner membrane component [Sulfobacillus acidophilus TPY]|uniref:Carbohydrate ABC transporter membrane protein 2, CUT1 family n=1 Tax=Sulfobacillus acidophilus (strain ATCC 700253 / DSM 10332 / NAL) TaxID=679936 RepID=G8TTJ0_SULAD|nr:binding-protein-dependent transport systems inner membrane component [Sulfobacillus acidophilus TPY]AEW05656.1 carbohydrate ABC transporter membrane protein 2, CUT1 family [Sulfobacillus acidophilus DSM 10332]